MAEAPPATSCALLVAEPIAGGEARLETARARLAERCRPVDGAATRAVLEGFARRPPAEERIRDALRRAHERLRRFQLADVHAALDEARAAQAELEPSPAGRALAVEAALREAELALVERDAAAARAALALALSVEPQLALDPERYPPTLLALLERTRAALASGPRGRLRLESTPAGAHVHTGGAFAGEAPLTVETPASGPRLVWLSLDGYRPRAVRADAGPDARVAVTLEPFDEEGRLGPLVEAVRQTDGVRRRQAALALAAALGVDAVAVLAARGDAPVVYARAPVEPPRAAAPLPVLVAAPSPPAPPPPPRKPWYRRGWVWGVIAGVAVTATATALAVYYTSPESLTVTCCK